MSILREASRWRTDVTSVQRVVRVALGIVGFAVAMWAANYSFERTSAWELSVFTFAMAYYLVGRGLPDVIFEPDRLPRLAFFVSLPISGSVIVYLAYAEWGQMWLAVLLGFIGGDVIQALLSWLFYPDVFSQETAQEEASLARLLGSDSWGEPGPHDLVPPRMFTGSHTLQG